MRETDFKVTQGTVLRKQEQIEFVQGKLCSCDLGYHKT